MIDVQRMFCREGISIVQRCLVFFMYILNDVHHIIKLFCHLTTVNLFFITLTDCLLTSPGYSELKCFSVMDSLQ